MRPRIVLASLLLASAVTAAPSGCGEDTPPVDMKPAGTEECVANPIDHLGLLNACVDPNVVEFIEKKPTLPLLNPDGTRPPLP